MSRLRVAMLVVGFPDDRNPGNGIFNLRAAEALRDYAELEVIRLRSWRPGRSLLSRTEVSGVPVTILTAPQIPGALLFNKSLFDYSAGARAVRLMREHDLIYSVGADSAGLLGSVWSRRAGVRHILHIIGSDVYDVLPRLKPVGALRDWHRHLHGVAAVCRTIGKRFCELYPDAPNVTPIYRGTNLEIFNPAGAAAEPLASMPPVKFLYLGGFAPHPTRTHDLHRKGGRHLLETYFEFESQLSTAGATLVLAGEGTDLANPIIAGFLQRVKRRESIVLAGRHAPKDVPALLRSVDAVVIPSFEEGLPNVAVESSGCGRAVIGTDVGGMREVVLDGETGIIVPPGDVKALGGAMLKLAADKVRISQLGQAARAHIVKNFDRRNFAPQMMALFERAMSLALTREAAS